jgi:ABC-type transport system involved in multi-copper enzyme maturation permease subunit
VYLGGAALLTLLATVRVRLLARGAARRGAARVGPVSPGGEAQPQAAVVSPDQSPVAAPESAVLFDAASGSAGTGTFPDGSAEESVAGEPAGAARRLAADEELVSARRKSRAPVAEGRSRSVGENPVLWREMSQRIAGTSRWWWVGLVLLLLCLLLVYSLAITMESLEDEALHVAVLPIFLLLILLEAGVFAAPAISSEKEASSWPILLSTTLRPHQILWSKAAGVTRRLVPISLLLAGHVLVFTIAGYLNPLCLLHAGLIAVGFTFFLIAVGLALSLRLERTTSAVVGTIVTGLALWAILPLVVGLLWGVLDGGDEGLMAMASINPIYWMVSAAAGAVDSLHPGYYRYMLLDDTVSPGVFTAVLFAVCGGYTLVALAILGSCINQFNRLAGRPS